LNFVVQNMEVILQVNSGLIQTSNPTTTYTWFGQATSIPVEGGQKVEAVTSHDPANVVVKIVVRQQELDHAKNDLGGDHFIAMNTANDLKYILRLLHMCVAIQSGM
jgi:hypothetical protein